MSEFLHYKKHVITAVDEFDFREQIKPSAIMQYFQDLATVHADEIGIGYSELKMQNLCWVLNRLSVVIDKSPLLGEEIIITTYPHKPGVVEAVRDYYITNTMGQSLIRGTSRWCVLDIHNKAIRRCAPLFSFAESAYNPDFAIKEGNPQLPDLRSLQGTLERDFKGKVNISDLDRNGHMNNARYGDIVINACGYSFYAEHAIKAFDFNFLSEMKIGIEYTVQHKTDGNISYFEADGDTRMHPIFRAKFIWK